MYPSNRVKRRPAPYEVELDEGKHILDLYKYGKIDFAVSKSPISLLHPHCHSSTDIDIL